ncbi:MAG: RsmB/NOP family class I SAM-dependent RNA methyltransferase [Candidatus Krumholzibacteria bacterium]|jgi:16S rRNA (cytosine1407-C5)-methyltransferase|nr:RsmB/NOP family class I SAM-dependent RNA methyltransferase [Candidatus Krumholzibacteria bacterium]MDP7022013.1 RsmB/NOP family class I SAM-dependent RNA methyltransferase [Candidatus Krumholzibacteria bacterium]
MPLPELFIERLSEIFSGEDLARVLDSYQSARQTVFRANPRKCQGDALVRELQSAGLHPEALDWPPAAYRVPAEERRALTETAAFAEGKLWVQNPSSMIPPLVLAAREGEEVLDLAAAPGSKTLQLAQSGARVTAVEKVRGRFFRLKHNLKNQGELEVETRLDDGIRFAKRHPEHFDRILLDAPCSSEGRFHESEPESTRYWSNRKIREMVSLQKRLIRSAFHALKPGGVLVYSTCTYAPEENELVLQYLLKWEKNAEIESLELPLDSRRPGLLHWRERELDPRISKACRIVPDDLWEGFFLARIRKTKDSGES